MDKTEKSDGKRYDQQLNRFSQWVALLVSVLTGYRIYSHISRKINDKMLPQKLGGATYRRVCTTRLPRYLTPAVLECYNCSLKT